MIQIKNGKIERTMLGVEDHGIFTCYLHLEFDDFGQGFGGYALDDWDKKEKRRIGIAFGTEFIKQILEVVGVKEWEDLKGKFVRVEHDDNHKIIRIGNIVEDKWFNPKDIEYLLTK